MHEEWSDNYIAPLVASKPRKKTCSHCRDPFADGTQSPSGYCINCLTEMHIAARPSVPVQQYFARQKTRPNPLWPNDVVGGRAALASVRA